MGCILRVLANVYWLVPGYAAFLLPGTATKIPLRHTALSHAWLSSGSHILLWTEEYFVLNMHQVQRRLQNRPCKGGFSKQSDSNQDKVRL